jgi:tagatose-1,6-bisphosphate aldolase non-catalytic subunit AgaZ/GatZ
MHPYLEDKKTMLPIQQMIGHVYRLGGREYVSPSSIILGKDHLGPLTWRHLSEAEPPLYVAGSEAPIPGAYATIHSFHKHFLRLGLSEAWERLPEW